MTHARGTRLSYVPVTTVLGLLELAVFIGFVISLAAGVTWVVVKLFPTPETKRAAKAAKTPSPS
jgi:hypothetical protein